MQKNPLQSAKLLIGILLTLLAVVAHHFFPERRLDLSPTAKDAKFFLLQFNDPNSPQVNWVDMNKMHFTCDFTGSDPTKSCSFNYLLSKTSADQGVDLSRYRTLNLKLRYTGNAHYVRVSVRSFDSRFSTLKDGNSPKINTINLHPQDFLQPVQINLNEFTVPEWWITQYDLPRKYAQRDLSNSVALAIDFLGMPSGAKHEMQIDSIEFTGDWISAEYWYLGILSLWMAFGTVYAASQWLYLHRKHREQRKKIRDLVDTNVELRTQKEKYQRLSTIDALTRAMNRHGIEQFVESLRQKKMTVSVIVIDLDHFKMINDHRGHYVGDRVLQSVGEILATYTRSTDGLGRWGGEEFVLVCPGASLHDATELAEKLRLRIMETVFIPEDPLTVTASVGVATTQGTQVFEDAFRHADQALYEAKSRGRNCVVAATDDQLHSMSGTRKSAWALITGRFKLHG